MIEVACPLALRHNVCAWCAKSGNRARIGLQNSNRIQRRFKYYIAPAGEQARPITGYYAGKTAGKVLTWTKLTIWRDAKESAITNLNITRYVTFGYLHAGRRSSKISEGDYSRTSPHCLRVETWRTRTEDGDRCCFEGSSRNNGTTKTDGTRQLLHVRVCELCVGHVSR